MKVLVRISRRIAARPEAVFGHLTDLGSHRMWNPEIVEISRGGTLALGDTYDTVSSFMGKRIGTQNLVTQLKPGRELEVKNSSGPLQYLVNYRLTAAGDGTELACRCQVVLASQLFHLAAPVIEMIMKDKLQRDLRTLGAAVEQSAVSQLS